MRGRWHRIVAAAAVGTAIGLASHVAVANAGSISAQCTSGGQTAACGSNWYTGPVSVTWQASQNPPPQSVSGCQLGIAYQYDGDTSKGLSCTATWSDKTFSGFGFPLQIEITNPTTSAAARPPDSHGWYNHPVAIPFVGNAFSGIASCTPATTYAGPNVVSTKVSGSCTDNAGKKAGGSMTLKYDAKPPKITGWKASRRPDHNGWYTHPVKFTFRGKDALSGIERCSTVTYSGPTSSKARVVGSCTDRAGNVTRKTVLIRYQAPPHLLAPFPGQRVTGPPLLQWTPVNGASYYNVQLFRGGQKILSVWPTGQSLRLPASWSFERKRVHLKPGRYQWYVWPGFGSRAAAQYGTMIGGATFTVVR